MVVIAGGGGGEVRGAGGGAGGDYCRNLLSDQGSGSNIQNIQKKSSWTRSRAWLLRLTRARCCSIWRGAAPATERNAIQFSSARRIHHDR